MHLTPRQLTNNKLFLYGYRRYKFKNLIKPGSFIVLINTISLTTNYMVYYVKFAYKINRVQEPIVLYLRVILLCTMLSDIKNLQSIPLKV